MVTIDWCITARPFPNFQKCLEHLLTITVELAESATFIRAPPALKIENFQLKKVWYFSYFCSNIHCGYKLELPRRGHSNKYPQSMFWIKNKKIRHITANSSFAI